MKQKYALSLNCMAIGSLPHTNVLEAMKLVEKNFDKIPFWPQLAKLGRQEDMIFQFLENLPGLCLDENSEKIYLENESDDFFEKLEEFFIDYEEITSESSKAAFEKYKISALSTATFGEFIKLIKKNKPDFAKGQIVGPFTLTTTLTDKEGKCAFYDETLREIIVKTLCLKALWQVDQIKLANVETTPIIFIDEPSISQLGTSAFITISPEEVTEIIKEVSDVIKQNGALSAIHCCGKCDWSIPIKAGVDIINLDGFFFAQNLSIFSEQIQEFLDKGGIIAWGIIPTLDKEALLNSNIDSMVQKFEEAVGYLVKKGIDKKIIIEHSMITPSCGAGSLSNDLAEKAMGLTKELSDKLKQIYK